MEALQKEPESVVKVRFHDCDPFNHLNNSRYLDYIVTARGDHLIDHYGYDLYAYAREQKMGWVSAQMQISYLAPAFLMESVVIRTRLLDAGTKSLLVEGTMWDAGKTQLKAVLWAKLVHFDLRAQRSADHPEELRQFFGNFVLPLPGKISFEERVAQLKQNGYHGK